MANATLYLGAVGCGKTYLMRQHIEAIRKDPDAPLIFICDHNGEWSDLPGIVIYEDAASWRREPSLCAVFQGVNPRDVAQLVCDVGWSLLVDDEIDALCHEGPWVGNPLREIIRRGRHMWNKAGVTCEVGALCATQRPAGIPGDLTGLFERVYLGKLTSANDVERVRKEGWIIGADSFAEVAAALRERRVGEFSTWPEETA